MSIVADYRIVCTRRCIVKLNTDNEMITVLCRKLNYVLRSFASLRFGLRYFDLPRSSSSPLSNSKPSGVHLPAVVVSTGVTLQMGR